MTWREGKEMHKGFIPRSQTGLVQAVVWPLSNYMIMGKYLICQMGIKCLPNMVVGEDEIRQWKERL